MKINDIVGAGKIMPLDKLIDVIKKGVGRFSKAYFDKKDADSKAYEIERTAIADAKKIKIISNAISESAANTGGIEYKDENVAITSPKRLLPEILDEQMAIDHRMENRILYQERKKQLNVESITAIAADELKEETTVTDDPVDEDWINRFFKIAEEVSDKQMQQLWGKILAGEVRKPKSFGIRTLELIKNLTQEEATIFESIAKYAIRHGGTYFIYKGSHWTKLQNSFAIPYPHIATLVDLGLLQPSNTVEYLLRDVGETKKWIFCSGDTIIIADVKANTGKKHFPIMSFSSTGEQIMRLLKTDAPYEYLKEFGLMLQDENIDVKYSQIISDEDGVITFKQPLLQFSWE